jgi:hypothetical protein
MDTRKSAVLVINDNFGLFVHVPPELSQRFSELIFRGANLWPDAPPEIKEAADLICNGKIMQDYKPK